MSDINREIAEWMDCIDLTDDEDRSFDQIHLQLSDGHWSGAQFTLSLDACALFEAELMKRQDSNHYRNYMGDYMTNLYDVICFSRKPLMPGEHTGIGISYTFNPFLLATASPTQRCEAWKRLELTA